MLIRIEIGNQMKMRYWDYHTHNYICNHAEGTLEDYVKAAIEKNLIEIGLSDHFPMHLISKSADVKRWAMNLEDFPDYIKECQRLREKYSDQIVVRVASEVDYTVNSFEGYTHEIKPFLDDFDYLIGSIHVLNLEFVGIRAIDGKDSPELIRKVGLDNFYKTYYSTLTKMVKTRFFDIVGHCDLPKKYGVHPSENSWEYILNFLDTVQSNEMVVEINNSGYYRPVGIQYPSDKIIRELVKRKIPITLGSDSHKTEYLAYRFEDAIAKLKKFEREEKVKVNLCKFSKREKTLVPLI